MEVCSNIDVVSQKLPALHCEIDTTKSSLLYFVAIYTSYNLN